MQSTENGTIQRMSRTQVARDGLPILAAYAAQGRPLTYGEHVEVMKRTWPERYAKLDPRFDFYQSALGLMSLQTLDRSGFAISSIVVNKHTRVPGGGFIDWNPNEWAKGTGFANLCGRLPFQLDWADEQRKTFVHFANGS